MQVEEKGIEVGTKAAAMLRHCICFLYKGYDHAQGGSWA